MNQSTPAAQQSDYRIEHDTMGEVRVPVSALYRAQTQRAVENFPISGTTLEPTHIVAIARVKKAAARINAELGIIDADKAKTVLAIKRTMNPGFAGIENELYFADNTLMIFGDAKAVIGDLVKSMSGQQGMH